MATTHISAVHKSVLVVEDDPLLRLLLTEVLSDAGYKTVPASNEACALLLMFNSDQIALILTDQDVAGLDATGLIARARWRHPNLPVVMVTGRSESVQLQMPDPPFRLFKKPFSMFAVDTAIAEMLSHGFDETSQQNPSVA